jgi:uncharacterized membrane protein YqjE
MDGETQMNTNGNHRGAEPNVAASFSELTHDVIELAELQGKLFALDIKNTSQKARTGLVLGLVGVSLLLGSIPVALFALAELMIRQFDWTRDAGYGLATLIGVLLSGGILAAAWASFRTGISTLERSRDELKRNITWIKSSLRTRTQPHRVERG